LSQGRFPGQFGTAAYALESTFEKKSMLPAGPARSSGVLVDTSHAARFGAVVTAIDRALYLDAVADDVAIAMGTFGCQRVNRTFKAVEGVILAVDHHVKGFVVVVSANFAACHGESPFEANH
jgi:hypothetical protein